MVTVIFFEKKTLTLINLFGVVRSTAARQCS